MQITVVFAQLRTQGKWEGVHAFVVRIRDDQLNAVRGVRIRVSGGVGGCSRGRVTRVLGGGCAPGWCGRLRGVPGCRREEVEPMRSSTSLGSAPLHSGLTGGGGGLGALPAELCVRLRGACLAGGQALMQNVVPAVPEQPEPTPSPPPPPPLPPTPPTHLDTYTPAGHGSQARARRRCAGGAALAAVCLLNCVRGGPLWPTLDALTHAVAVWLDLRAPTMSPSNQPTHLSPAQWAPASCG